MLGRVTGVTTPDGAVAATRYAGNQVTVTDQASHKKQYGYDALGRLSSVNEDPSGVNYQTTYGYDALGNLTSVNQAGRTRSFTYDSLSRLRKAINPESGTVNYVRQRGKPVHPDRCPEHHHAVQLRCAKPTAGDGVFG